MLPTGYSEGIDSECGICWRARDTLSLREFIGIAPGESVLDHSSFCRILQRLPLQDMSERWHVIFWPKPSSAAAELHEKEKTG